MRDMKSALKGLIERTDTISSQYKSLMFTADRMPSGPQVDKRDAACRPEALTADDRCVLIC